jgi:hypothetical protein
MLKHPEEMERVSLTFKLSVTVKQLANSGFEFVKSLPVPQYGSNWNDANTVTDILDDQLEALGPHWANGKRHEQGDDSQYNFVVPLDHILAYRPRSDRSSLDLVFVFYRSIEPYRDTSQLDDIIHCANVYPGYQRSLNFPVGNLRVIRTHSVSLAAVETEECSSKSGSSNPSRSRVGWGICI